MTSTDLLKKKIELTPKQLETIRQAKSHINIWEGSVRSGKTFASLIGWLHFVLNCPDDDLIMVGRTSATIYNNAVKWYQEFYPQITTYQPGNQLLILGSKRVELIGANDQTSYTKIAGNTRSGAYVDEASLIPWSFMQMLDQRLSKDHSRMFCTTNPDSPFHPLKEWIDKADNKNFSVFTFRLDDNPFLSQDYVERLKLTNKGLYYKRYILGEWCQAEGAIFDFFEESLHIIEKPPSYAKYYLVGIDYGTKNPCAFVLIGVNDDVRPSIWVEKEYYYDSSKIGRQKTDGQYAIDFKKFIEGYPIRKIYIDPSAASFKTELSRHGIHTVDANNDVIDGIRTVSSLMASENFKICKQCKNTIREMQSYVWDENAAKKGEDKPVKENDHILDGIRYTLHTHFGNKKTIREKTTHEKEVEMIKRFNQSYQNQTGIPWGYQQL
jgi:PBSX family phage terminase large subunit